MHWLKRATVIVLFGGILPYLLYQTNVELFWQSSPPLTPFGFTGGGNPTQEAWDWMRTKQNFLLVLYAASIGFFVWKGPRLFWPPRRSAAEPPAPSRAALVMLGVLAALSLGHALAAHFEYRHWQEVDRRYLALMQEPPPSDVNQLAEWEKLMQQGPPKQPWSWRHRYRFSFAYACALGAFLIRSYRLPFKWTFGAAAWLGGYFWGFLPLAFYMPGFPLQSGIFLGFALPGVGLLWLSFRVRPARLHS